MNQETHGLFRIWPAETLAKRTLGGTTPLGWSIRIPCSHCHDMVPAMQLWRHSEAPHAPAVCIGCIVQVALEYLGNEHLGGSLAVAECPHTWSPEQRRGGLWYSHCRECGIGRVRTG